MTDKLTLKSIISIIGSELHTVFADNKNNDGLSDLQRSLIDLSGIAILNLETIADYFDDNTKVYPVASAARLIIECYADAYHLTSNPDEATKYHNAQGAISQKLKSLPSLEDKQSFIGSKELGEAGKLSVATTQRVISLPENYSGAYSILCCYIHPNMAAPSWFIEDKTNYLNRYFLFVAITAFFSIIYLMTEKGINYKADRTIALQKALLDDYIGDLWSENDPDYLPGDET